LDYSENIIFLCLLHSTHWTWSTDFTHPRRFGSLSSKHSLSTQLQPHPYTSVCTLHKCIVLYLYMFVFFSQAMIIFSFGNNVSLTLTDKISEEKFPPLYKFSPLCITISLLKHIIFATQVHNPIFEIKLPLVSTSCNL
jgi:hypothetical protein